MCLGAFVIAARQAVRLGCIIIFRAIFTAVVWRVRPAPYPVNLLCQQAAVGQYPGINRHQVTRLRVSLDFGVIVEVDRLPGDVPKAGLDGIYPPLQAKPFHDNLGGQDCAAVGADLHAGG